VKFFRVDPWPDVRVAVLDIVNGAQDEIRVPLSEERVEVQKRPVVREEVRVGKREVEGRENKKRKLSIKLR